MDLLMKKLVILYLIKTAFKYKNMNYFYLAAIIMIYIMVHYSIIIFIEDYFNTFPLFWVFGIITIELLIAGYFIG